MGVSSDFVKRIEFLGPQEGPAERELQRRVEPVLSSSGRIERAYLARVRYGACSSESVAMCFGTRQPQESVVREVASVFASMFGRDQHLDMVFVTESDEKELARVCSPFFESGS